MAENGLETEAKFYVTDLAGINTRLLELGARLLQPRIFEQNLRFDTPDATLSHSHQALRLRQDTTARLTFKGPRLNSQTGISRRQEFEFSVGDFDQAQSFLQALGYQVIFIYEKYRTVFSLKDTEVMLDEMPYGNFIEIESSDPRSIRRAAGLLKIRWETSVPFSYAALFSNLKEKNNLSFRDLSFANFASQTVSAEDLGVRASDQP
ncbi:MAG: class IV adenylate cyclase [Anaerolineales bacterium]|nr:class IV adenylate cyclase [Anaerolineales bacterium]